MERDTRSDRGKTIKLDDKELDILKEFCDRCQFSKECLENLGGFQVEEALRCAISYLWQDIRHKDMIVWVERIEI